MNPLSAWTYHRRHLPRAAFLISLLTFITVGLYLLIGFIDSTFLEPNSTFRDYYNYFSQITPFLDEGLDDEAVKKIETHPGVAKIIPENGLNVTVHSPTGTGFPFKIFGLGPDDISLIMEATGSTIIDGQMIRTGSNEVLISKNAAANLGLQVGDEFSKETDSAAFYSIVTPMIVAGIIEGDAELGFASYEFINTYEDFPSHPDHILIFPKQGELKLVNQFLDDEIARPGLAIFSQSVLLREMRFIRLAIGSFMAGPIVLIATLVMTMVITLINQFAYTERLPEFGVLLALGRSKKWMMRRLTMELITLSGGGWLFGIILALFIFREIDARVFAPVGMSIGAVSFIAIFSTVLLPIAVVFFTYLRLRKTFKQLDTVAIIERGILSQETKPPSGKIKQVAQRPLSSRIYFQRHKSRKKVFTRTIVGLMVVVTAITFIIGSSEYAVQNKNFLQQVSIMRPKSGRVINSEVVSELTHKSGISSVIPAKVIYPITMQIPPAGIKSVAAYAVAPDDMDLLIDLYDLDLLSGTLPAPGTNQLVISEATAKNRQLHIGDVVGSQEISAYRNAPILPMEMVISGIFATPKNTETWAAFASLEFINETPDYANQLEVILLAPMPGNKEAMDKVLLELEAESNVEIETYQEVLASRKSDMQRRTYFFLGLETLVALIAAVALTALNTVFIIQRQTELGILYALGRSKRFLTGRLVREMGRVIATSWGAGVIIIFSLLFLAKAALYNPIGLEINLLDPLPWLFTIPLPIIVLLASYLTAIWGLSRIDAIRLIEQR